MTITILVGDDKQDFDSRIKRGNALRGTILTSAIIKAHPDLAEAIHALILRTDDLIAADKEVEAIQDKLAIACAARDATTVAYDAQYGVCVSLVQKYAPTAEEARATGFEPLAREKYALAIPITIEGRYDHTARVLRLHVVMPQGMTACHLEVSTDPSNEASWRRVRGDGLRRRLSGYAPGTYWFRASSVVAEDESDFCAPVMVVVK